MGIVAAESAILSGVVYDEVGDGFHDDSVVDGIVSNGSFEYEVLVHDLIIFRDQSGTFLHQFTLTAVQTFNAC